jgi:hypothetical protein
VLLVGLEETLVVVCRLVQWAVLRGGVSMVVRREPRKGEKMLQINRVTPH